MDTSQKDLAAAKRRRQWFQDRAMSRAIAQRGSRYVTSLMGDDELWEAACRALLDLEDDLSGRALPRSMENVQDALKCLLELRNRGRQERLFDY